MTFPEVYSPTAWFNLHGYGYQTSNFKAIICFFLNPAASFWHLFLEIEEKGRKKRKNVLCKMTIQEIK